MSGEPSFWDPPAGQSKHLVLACAKKKNPDVRQHAGDMYVGAIWQMWRSVHPDNRTLPPDFRRWVLSAKYGLVPFNLLVDPYDHSASVANQKALVRMVAQQWKSRGQATDDDEVVVIGGSVYQAIAARAGLPIVSAIHGSSTAASRGGIGLMRRRVKVFAELIATRDDAWEIAKNRWPPSKQGTPDIFAPWWWNAKAPAPREAREILGTMEWCLDRGIKVQLHLPFAGEECQKIIRPPPQNPA